MSLPPQPFLPNWPEIPTGSNPNAHLVPDKNSWTQFRFEVTMEEVIWVGELLYQTPTSPSSATFDALRKAEFMAATLSAPFDECNCKITLWT